jgi:hypothetical protein
MVNGNNSIHHIVMVFEFDGDQGYSAKLKFVRLGYRGTSNLLYGLYPMLEECKQITHT